MSQPTLNPDSLRINLDDSARAICAGIRETVLKRFRKRGLVVAMSGGVRQQRRRRAGRARPRQRPRVRPAACPNATRPPKPCPSASCSPSTSASSRRHEDITGILDAAGCYRRRDDAIRTVIPNTAPAGNPRSSCPRSSTATNTASSPSSSNRPPASARRRASPWTPTSGSSPPPTSSSAPQDARILPRRPAQLRRRRHAQPPGVRPGLLRQARRRRRRHQADRPPLQDPGLRAGAVPRRAGGDPQPAAHDRHLLAARNRQEEFYFSLPYDKMDLSSTEGIMVIRPPRSPPEWDWKPPRSNASSVTSSPNAAWPATSTRRRSSSKTSTVNRKTTAHPNDNGAPAEPPSNFQTTTAGSPVGPFVSNTSTHTKSLAL